MGSWVLLLGMMQAAGPTTRAEPADRLETASVPVPRAELRWDGAAVVRSAVAHNPGFVLVYRLDRDGRTIGRMPADARDRFVPALRRPGKYSVVLEALVPGKPPETGDYRAISNVLERSVPPPLARHHESPLALGDVSEHRRDAGELREARAELDRGDLAGQRHLPAELAEPPCLPGDLNVLERKRGTAWSDRVKRERARVNQAGKTHTHDTPPTATSPR